jgi:ankyrin repeat protein
MSATDTISGISAECLLTDDNFPSIWKFVDWAEQPKLAAVCRRWCYGIRSLRGTSEKASTPQPHFLYNQWPSHYKVIKHPAPIARLSLAQAQWRHECGRYGGSGGSTASDVASAAASDVAFNDFISQIQEQAHPDVLSYFLRNRLVDVGRGTYFALSIAARSNRTDVLALLCRFLPSELSSVRRLGKELSNIAAVNGHRETLEFLAEQRALCVSSYAMNALMQSPRYQLADFILENNGAPKLSDTVRRAIRLCMLAANGNIDEMRQILDVDAGNTSDSPSAEELKAMLEYADSRVLRAACANGHSDAVKLLFDRYPTFSAQVIENAATDAIYRLHPKIVSMLISEKKRRLAATDDAYARFLERLLLAALSKSQVDDGEGRDEASVSDDTGMGCRTKMAIDLIDQLEAALQLIGCSKDAVATWLFEALSWAAESGALPQACDYLLERIKCLHSDILTLEWTLFLRNVASGGYTALFLKVLDLCSAETGGDLAPHLLIDAMLGAAHEGHADVVAAIVRYCGGRAPLPTTSNFISDDDASAGSAADAAASKIGQSALINALTSDHTEVVRELVSAGFLKSSSIDDLRQLLFIAVLRGRLESVKLLIEKFPSGRCGDPTFLSNLLCLAVKHGNEKVVRFLVLECGADPCAFGFEPLRLALYHYRFELAEWLREIAPEQRQL